VIALIGLAVVAAGMAMLPWAHRYMQQSRGEGLAFVGAAAVLVLGGSIALAGAMVLLTGEQRAAATATTAVLTVCAFAAFWVWAQGTNCIGPC
jgi:hypothetical protein